MGTHMKRRSKRKSRKSRKRRAGAVDRCILKCKADADAVIKQAKKAKKALVTRTGKSLKERMAAYEKAAAGVKRGVGEMSADAIKARKEIDDAKKVMSHDGTVRGIQGMGGGKRKRRRTKRRRKSRKSKKSRRKARKTKRRRKSKKRRSRRRR